MRIRLNILFGGCFLFLFLCSAGNLFAQQGNNPFDLPQRQTDSATTIIDSASDNPFDLQNRPTTNVENSPAASDNPFDLNNATTPQPSTPTPAPPTTNKTNPFDIERFGSPKNTATEVSPSPILQPKAATSNKSNRNFLFWASTLSLLFITVLITLYKPLIGQIYRAFLNDNMLKLKHREQGNVLNLSFALLYLSYFINAGFFLYLCIKHFGWEGSNHWQLFTLCILGFAAIFLIKHLILRLLGYIFPVDKELRQYSFTIVVFNIVLGLVLVPFNLLIAFGPSQLPKYLIFSVITLTVLLYGFRIIRSLLIAGRYISLHKFHFFMYLCTVEIAPTVVLVKLLLLLNDGAY